MNAQPRAPSTVFPPRSGHQVLSLQQMVNVLQSERGALANELHEARCGADDQDVPTVKIQAVSRQAAGSRRDLRCLIPMMPQFVPNDVTNWLQDRQAEQGSDHRDLQYVSDVGKRNAEGVIFVGMR